VTASPLLLTLSLVHFERHGCLVIDVTKGQRSKDTGDEVSGEEIMVMDIKN
jgi:hypothetical protein